MLPASKTYMDSKLVRPAKFGTSPTNSLKLRSLQENNNTYVRITEKNVYKCRAQYRKNCKTTTTNKHVIKNK